ncbi:MAG TPA: hypothetical protein VFS43_38970, partial [Polyangiaceae bacterium]|nr:hypothetical protein [Polyangiaceae bacterium]
MAGLLLVGSSCWGGPTPHGRRPRSAVGTAIERGEGRGARRAAAARGGARRARPGPGPGGAAAAGPEAAAQAIDLITKQIGADQVAAVIVEPIQGEGGFVVPGQGF